MPIFSANKLRVVKDFARCVTSLNANKMYTITLKPMTAATAKMPSPYTMDLWTLSCAPHLLRTDCFVVHENGIFYADTMQRVTRKHMCAMLVPIIRRLENMLTQSI